MHTSFVQPYHIPLLSPFLFIKTGRQNILKLQGSFDPHKKLSGLQPKHTQRRRSKRQEAITIIVLDQSRSGPNKQPRLETQEADLNGVVNSILSWCVLVYSKQKKKNYYGILQESCIQNEHTMRHLWCNNSNTSWWPQDEPHPTRLYFVKTFKRARTEWGERSWPKTQTNHDTISCLYVRWISIIDMDSGFYFIYFLFSHLLVTVSLSTSLETRKIPDNSKKKGNASKTYQIADPQIKSESNSLLHLLLLLLLLHLSSLLNPYNEGREYTGHVCHHCFFCPNCYWLYPSLEGRELPGDSQKEV